MLLLIVTAVVVYIAVTQSAPELESPTVDSKPVRKNIVVLKGPGQPFGAFCLSKLLPGTSGLPNVRESYEPHIRDELQFKPERSRFALNSGLELLRARVRG